MIMSVFYICHRIPSGMVGADHYSGWSIELSEGFMQQRTRMVLTLGLIGLATAVATFTAMAVAFPPQSLLVHPGGPHESLCFVSSSLNSPTNATLTLLNCGYPYTTTLIAYYVHYGQDVYSNANWAGPSIPMNTQASFNILIDGQAFTFHPGNSYSITIISARHNQFGITLVT